LNWMDRAVGLLHQSWRIRMSGKGKGDSKQGSDSAIIITLATC
jgi:hypothetical protein